MSELKTRKQPGLWYIAVVCGMASYLDGAGLVASSLALTIYVGSGAVTPDQLGILIAVLTLSAALGAAIGGRLGDRLGRRRVFTVTMVFIIVGAGILVLTEGFPLMLVGIILMGVGIGADLPVSLATISEAATGRNRGKAVVFSHVLWAVGILSSLLLGAIFGGLGRTGGQILFAQVGIVALVVLFLRLRIGESQLWLTARDERRRGITTIRADRSRVRDLFRAPYFRTFAVLGIAYAFMGIGASTWGGFGAFIAQDLAGVTVQLFSATALITNVASILAAVWFMRLVDTRWRMPFFAAGTVMIIIGYSIVAIFGFSLATLIASLALTSVGMAFAFETILKVWMQESFPTMIRSTAQGSIMGFARLIPVPIQVATPALLLADGQLFFIALTVISVIAGVMLWVTFRKRTRTEFDIEQQEDPEAVPVAAL